MLLPFAGPIAEADERLAPRLDRAALEEVVGLVPDAWLGGDGEDGAPGERRAAYVEYLERRLTAPRGFAREAEDARAAALSPSSTRVLRVVPRPERGERLNAGVVLFARTMDFLGARVGLDPRRLAALSPETDAAAVARQLEGLARIAAGDAEAGPIARLDRPARFHWLVAPSSTVIQPSRGAHRALHRPRGHAGPHLRPPGGVSV